MKLPVLLPLVLSLFVAQAPAQEPLWIWHTKKAADGEVRFFRKEFTLPAVPKHAKLHASCDNEAIVYLNGQEAGETPDWKKPVLKSVEGLLHQGPNVLAVRGKNHEGVA